MKNSLIIVQRLMHSPRRLRARGSAHADATGRPNRCIVMIDGWNRTGQALTT